MVKKTLLSLAIAATAAGLAGCNISSVQDHDKVDQTAVDAGSGDAQPAVERKRPTRASRSYSPHAARPLPRSRPAIFEAYTREHATQKTGRATLPLAPRSRVRSKSTLQNRSEK